MPEKSNVVKEAMKHKGFFDYSEVYNFCFNWLKDEGYNVSEDVYTEKLSSFGKEVIIEWTAKKKISDYFMNQIQVKWHILGMNDAEVEVEGKKQKTNKGEVKLTFVADLVSDYEEKWEDNPSWKFMRGIYDKYIIRTTREQYEARLQDKAEEYIEQTKSFLRLEGKK